MSTIGRIGFRAGVGAAIATVAYDVVQVLQVAGVLHFPIDEILIFATSLGIVVPFVLEMVALHHTRVGDARFWTRAGLVFTTMYAVFGSANYVVQLTTVIPAKLRGEAETVRVLEQTPHSLLWDFDALAYIAMRRVLLSDVLPAAAVRRLSVGLHGADVHVARRVRTSS